MTGMNTSGTPEQSQRILCGVLAILLGSFGVHRFVLGDVKGGILRIVISLVTCGAAWILWLVEGIIYLTKTDADFVQTYQVNKKAWF